MMINIQASGNSSGLKVQATAEIIKGNEVWRIVLPKNETLFITRLNGQWRSVGKLIISDDLLDEIGCRLHPLAIANTLNLNRLANEHRSVSEGRR
jgi:hypothetical protein